MTIESSSFRGLAAGRRASSGELSTDPIIIYRYPMTFRWALIDLKTSGLHIKHDKIIEIAVIILTETGIERTWHSLINPDLQISHEITQLTGITNDMLAGANLFIEAAAHLNKILHNLN